MGFRRQIKDEIIRLHIEEGQSTRAFAKHISNLNTLMFKES
jgi:hypothetical protein